MKKLFFSLFIVALGLFWGCSLKKETIMVPNTGRLCFKVVPSDAELYVDGSPMGKANEFSGKNCLELSAGRHQIKLISSGFEPYEKEIYLGNQMEQKLSIRLNKEKTR